MIDDEGLFVGYFHCADCGNYRCAEYCWKCEPPAGVAEVSDAANGDEKD